ncbi:MAG: thioredoxin family protein [Bacteroidales bacterium]
MGIEKELTTGRILADFYAPWCNSCKELNPFLEKCKIKVVKVDVDVYPEIASRFGVLGLPTVILLENGEEIERFTGNRIVEKLKELKGI